MKRKVLIILIVAAIAGFLSSCGTVEDCPAYRVQTEQPA
jgi:hypothetical protein